MRKPLGSFLFFVGLILLVLFVFSDIAEQPQFGLFAGGAVCLILAVALWLTSPRPAPGEPPARFRTVKKLIQRKKKA